MVGQTSKIIDHLNRAGPGYAATDDPEIGKKKTAEQPEWWRDAWEELKFAWVASEELWLDCIPGIGHDRIKALEDWGPIIRWNPVWWLLVGSCVTMILPGHLFHALVGQGGPVRSDETKAERVVREAWIYCYSGDVMIMFAYDAYALLFPGYLRDRPAALSDLVALGMEAWYILGNVHILHSMAARDTNMVHAMSVNRITFGITLVVLCIMSWHANGFASPASTLDLEVIAWAIRFMFALWMGCAPLGFANVLNMSYDEDSDHEGSLWTKAGYGSVFVTLGAIAPPMLVGVTFYLLTGGVQQFYLVLVPAMVIFVALMLDGVERTTAKSMLATWTALLPIVVVDMSFAVAGPDLWQALSGY